MCGIALIINGACIDCSSVCPSLDQLQQYPIFSVDDFMGALHRRGPDHLGSTKLVPKRISVNVEEVVEPLDDSIASANEVTEDDNFNVVKPAPELHFIGATLHLRGISPVFQPLEDDSGNILVYNGEIFGGLRVDSDSNDTEALMHALGRCYSSTSGPKNRCPKRSNVPELLSTIMGPWALIYWQDSSNTLWFGRDAFGRRSLLVHWPTSHDCQFLLSSVSPTLLGKNCYGSDMKDRMVSLDFLEELPCGIYSIEFIASKDNGFSAGTVRKHEWTNPLFNDLIRWERTHVEPSSNQKLFHNISTDRGQHILHRTYESDASLESGKARLSISQPAHKVLIALKDSVMRRSILNPMSKVETGISEDEKLVPVAVLFSGGLDSMILAALLSECLEPCYEIDLLNVSFDGQSAPDRISAKAGVKELLRIAPLRRWNLVEIDAELSNLALETEHVTSLINPSKTYMDLNIGIALWLAAGGDGWVDEEIVKDKPAYQRKNYKSKARILLVGSGADEQCAGYGRHRTKFRLGGWTGLNDEMKLDMQRIWKRNLGRDDRCISDSGKEARFPFLDEDVIRVLLEIPLWEVADLNLPSGIGDKKILREVAQLLGIEAGAFLPKRAIQFGSRIARESNRMNFGSNRAANQASAGTVVFHKPRD